MMYMKFFISQQNVLKLSPFTSVTKIQILCKFGAIPSMDSIKAYIFHWNHLSHTGFSAYDSDEQKILTFVYSPSLMHKLTNMTKHDEYVLPRLDC